MSGVRGLLIAGMALLGGCVGDGSRDEYGYRPAPVEDDRRAQPMERLDDRVTAVAAPRPAWQARTVATDATTVDASNYVVRPGDSLGLIAMRTGAGTAAIAHANALIAPYVLAPGQRLAIPGGRYHEVRAGDTGIAIARAYRSDWSRIVTANDLAEPYILRTGQRILIPGTGGGAGNRPASLDERAAAFHIDIDDILTGGEPAAGPGPVRRPDRSASVARPYPTYDPVTPPTSFSGGFLWPVRGPVVKRFGRGASGERNDGIKIAVPVGTAVKAAADGVVAYAGNEVAGLGGLVILKHGDNWTSVYGHLSQLLVQRGQQVRRGQTVALSGDSGFADRPELHFELRKKRLPVDPQAQLPRS